MMQRRVFSDINDKTEKKGRKYVIIMIKTARMGILIWTSCLGHFLVAMH